MRASDSVSLQLYKLPLDWAMPRTLKLYNIYLGKKKKREAEEDEGDIKAYKYGRETKGRDSMRFYCPYSVSDIMAGGCLRDTHAPDRLILRYNK